MPLPSFAHQLLLTLLFIGANQAVANLSDCSGPISEARARAQASALRNGAAPNFAEVDEEESSEVIVTRVGPDYLVQVIGRNGLQARMKYTAQQGGYSVHRESLNGSGNVKQESWFTERPPTSMSLIRQRNALLLTQGSALEADRASLAALHSLRDEDFSHARSFLEQFPEFRSLSECDQLTLEEDLAILGVPKISWQLKEAVESLGLSIKDVVAQLKGENSEIERGKTDTADRYLNILAALSHVRRYAFLSKKLLMAEHLLVEIAEKTAR